MAPNVTAWGNVSIQNTGTNAADLWVEINNDYGYRTGTDTAKSLEPAATDINGTITYALYSSASGLASAEAASQGSDSRSGIRLSRALTSWMVPTRR